MLKVGFTSVSQVVVVTKKLMLKRSLIPFFEYCCVWKLSKGKRLNVYVAVFEDIWFGKGQRLHRLVITWELSAMVSIRA